MWVSAEGSNHNDDSSLGRPPLMVAVSGRPPHCTRAPMHEQHEGVAEVMGMERSREKGTRGQGGPRVFLVILICLKHSYSTVSMRWP